MLFCNLKGLVRKRQESQGEQLTIIILHRVWTHTKGLAGPVLLRQANDFQWERGMDVAIGSKTSQFWGKHEPWYEKAVSDSDSSC